MSRSFACGCSEESRTEAESWLREVLPGMAEGEESILTGEQKPYRYTNAAGEVVSEGIRDVHRPMELTEILMQTLEDEGMKRNTTYQVSIGSDQWCGLSVVGEPWAARGKKWDGGEYPPGDDNIYGAQYDYGLLPHALAAAILQIREQCPVEDTEVD